VFEIPFYSLNDVYAAIHERFDRAAVSTKAKTRLVRVGQGLVTLTTALALKKESTTTLFTDKILQQLNTVTAEDSNVIKGTIILELMRLDIQAHLLSRTGQEDKLRQLEGDCNDFTLS
jgi:hypothetical protein